MPVYEIAGLRVGYEPRFDLLKKRSEKYICSGKPEFNIGVTDEVIERQLEYYNGVVSCAELEYLWVGTAFNVKLLEYNGMYLHSSTVVADGNAYSFSAPCGTGKSTHTALWLKLLGERAYIINDDKAAIRKTEDGYRVYGTPFSGKHDISVNTSAPLKGICFVEQAENNSIEPVDIDDAVRLLISQTLRPSNADRMVMMCDFIDGLVRDIPVYRLRCNMDIEAAELSFKTMSSR